MKKKPKIKKNWSRKAVSAQIREDFIEAGGYDGRYRSRVIPSKKVYKRVKNKKQVKED